MKADPAAQRQLLDVQELDARLDALDHRRRTLPELAAHQEARSRAEQLHARERDLSIQVSDLTTAQQKADADVEQVRARRERDRTRMESGQIADAKALQRMQHEMVSLERRITTLEDEELEVMEQLETAQTSYDEVAVSRREAAEDADGLAAVVEQRTAEIDAEREQVAAERAGSAAGLPDDLVALYTRLREQKGGVGAAVLQARQCQGCRLTLDSSVLASMAKAPADDVIRCEECNRILVRTDESGL